MLSSGEVIFRLAAATLLAALVGIERERRHAWNAGLRTHMMVSVGSCLFTLASAHAFNDVLSPERVVLDPSRISAQIVSGIGFLGAGAILLRKDFIRGLTTASSIWTVAAIGLACGGGMYLAAISATAFTLLILAGFRPIEHRYFQRGIMHRLQVRTNGGSSVLLELRTMAQAAGLKLVDFKMQGAAHPSGVVRFDLTLQGDLPQLLDMVKLIEEASNDSRSLAVNEIAGRLGERG